MPQSMPQDAERHRSSLILDYYSRDRSDRIAMRKRMAMQIGAGLNALRIRAYRIRERLFECVTRCLEAPA